MSRPITGQALLAVHGVIWERTDTDPAAFGTTSFIEGISSALKDPQWAAWLLAQLISEGMPTEPDIDWPALLEGELAR